MQTKYKNIKSTCSENVTNLILPQPTADLIAKIVGVSESYVKKVRTGDRNDDSDKAELVKYCNELIIGGQEVLVKAVKCTIDKAKENQSHK